MEIDKLWDKRQEGPVAFLKFIQSNYHNWKNKKIELTEEDLKDAKIKKTIKGVKFHYHPDRQKQDKDGVFNAKDIFMRNQIMMCLNSLDSDLKEVTQTSDK